MTVLSLFLILYDAFIESDGEAGSALRPVLSFDGSVLLLDNHAGQGQSDADAGAEGTLSFIKPLKKMWQILRLDARTVILNDQLSVAMSFS